MAGFLRGNKKVWVHFRADEAPVEYEFVREVPFRSHVAALCKQLKAPGSVSRYTLFLEESASYVSLTEHSSGSDGVMNYHVIFQNPGNVLLRLLPEFESAEIIANLQNSNLGIKKRTIFEAKSKQGGVKVLLEAVSTTSGSTQAYSLQALQSAMTYGFGWESITQPMIEMLVRLINSSNLNICKSAIQITTTLIESPHHITPTLEALASIPGRPPFENLVILLHSVEEDGIRSKFVQTLEKLGINASLHKQFHCNEHEDFVRQLARYQQLKFSTLQVEAYDKNNSEHEDLLQSLWSATFPDVELDGRVSQQWKWLGFQGTDPATDFRGMGLNALRHLLYFAQTRNVEFRALVLEQKNRAQNSYPFATAGINLSQLIYELFGINQRPARSAAAPGQQQQPPPPQQPQQQQQQSQQQQGGKAPLDDGSAAHVFPILFDHVNALEEIYCIVFQVLNHTWDDMEASYMDFPKVMASVKKKASDALVQSRTISRFDRLLSTWKRSSVQLSGWDSLLSNEVQLAPSSSASASSASSSSPSSSPSSSSSSSANAQADSEAELLTPEQYQEQIMSELQAEVSAAVKQLVHTQKCSYLIEHPCNVTYLEEAAGKRVVPRPALLKLSADKAQLLVLAAAAPSETIVAVPVDAVKSVLTGEQLPAQYQSTKKNKDKDSKAADDSGDAMFGVQLADNRTLAFSTAKADLPSCADGIRALRAQPMLCPETLDDMQVLTSSEMCFRMIHLKRARLPNKLPVIPSLPPPPLPGS